MAFLKEFIIFNILKNYYMCRTRENCSIFGGINSSYLTYYKITTCVGQEETAVLLEEFIIFNPNWERGGGAKWPT